MSDQFLAEIRIFATNFAPREWALCNGQLMAISQNTALFSLLGTTYGGDGRSTFALPNLMGGVPLHVGLNQPGPGLSVYDLGEMAGTPTVTLLQPEMPMHTHPPVVSSANATGTVSASNQMARPAKGSFQAPNTGLFYSSAAPQTLMSTTSITFQGGSQPHNNIMPTLALTYCIAVQGSFPPRS